MTSRSPRTKANAEDLEKKNWKPYYATEYDPIKAASINGLGRIPHDRAVIRALESKYTPSKEVPDAKILSRTILVAQLPPHVAEDELQKLFSKYGKVKNVKVIRDIVTKRSKGYGFVEFEKERHFQRAYDEKEITLGSHVLIVDKAISRTLPGWKPRRLGGGFGGTKTSGQLRFGCRTRPWLRPLFSSERRLRKYPNQ